MKTESMSIVKVGMALSTIDVVTNDGGVKPLVMRRVKT
jgi:hypothetical protein